MIKITNYVTCCFKDKDFSIMACNFNCKITVYIEWNTAEKVLQ